MGLRRNPKLKW